jgi:hypothetical protein
MNLHSFYISSAFHARVLVFPFVYMLDFIFCTIYESRVISPPQMITNNILLRPNRS